ncbi:PaaX family transcriptional regulator C-terminal domain-containing protein [Kitasatospora sp. NPDC087315]|uniref:PaaX family transcriptional regulator C-terminal domain-containing protein n=1 Tax=Kitasatospora sp. NPDC087315 TaxID=3364069 RepID=UPI0038288A19
MLEIPTRVLVEAMVRADGTVDCGELYAVAGLLGMTDQQVRLTINRLAADGRFVQEGRGRRAVLRATVETRRTIEPTAGYIALMYAQDRGEAPWDGIWHLAGFAVPEHARPARDALREAITGLGGAPVQNGLYVSPHAWEEPLRAEAAALGVLGNLTLLTSRDLHTGDADDPRALARRWWPLAELAEGHERLGALAADRLARLAAHPSDTEQLTIAIELAAAFTEALEPDPLLPPELLPQPWPGTAARALVARCWALLLADRRPGAPRLFDVYADVVEAVTA